MALCDMCGKETGLVSALIEGTELNVCKQCAKFGKIVRTSRPVEAKKPVYNAIKAGKSEPAEIEDVIEILVKDYGKLIKDARERSGLKQKDFANKLNEKASLMQKVETGRHEPSIALAQKIEKFLKINLIEESRLDRSKFSKTESSTLTVGDFIKNVKS